MIEKHIYQCEVCGKEFAFEDECLAHELKCKTAGLEHSVIIMDNNENILSLDNWRKAIDRAYFVYITNQEAADRLEELFNRYNYTFPTEYAQETVLYPALFAYESDKAYWKTLQDVENEYNELLAAKDKMQYYLLNKNISERNAAALG